MSSGDDGIIVHAPTVEHTHDLPALGIGLAIERRDALEATSGSFIHVQVATLELGEDCHLDAAAPRRPAHAPAIPEVQVRVRVRVRVRVGVSVGGLSSYSFTEHRLSHLIHSDSGVSAMRSLGLLSM